MVEENKSTIPTNRIQEMFLPPLKNKISFTEAVDAIRIFLRRKLKKKGAIRSSIMVIVRIIPGTNFDKVRIQVKVLPDDSRINTTQRWRGGKPNLKKSLTKVSQGKPSRLPIKKSPLQVS